MEEANTSIATWKQLKSDDSIKRYGHSSVVIEDLIVTFGGYNMDSPESLVVAYDLKQNICQTLQTSDTKPANRAFHTSCHYKEQTQIVFGGIGPGFEISNETILLTLSDREPSSYKWEVVSTIGSEKLFRLHHSANIYKKEMYIFGGLDALYQDNNELWCLNLDSFEWKQCKPTGIIPAKRCAHCSCLYKETIFIFGGLCEEKKIPLNDFFMLSLKDMHWEKIISAGALPFPRERASMSLKDDSLYLFGGCTDRMYFNDTFIYDVDTNIWKEYNVTGDIPTIRFFHTSITYKDSLLIWGGCEEEEGGNRTSLSEIYSLDVNLKKQKKHSVKGSSDRFFSQMRQLLFSKEHSDVIFQVEGEEIPASKNLLSIRSDFFYKMFNSGMMESHAEIINVPNIKSITFKAILEFIYCNTTVLDEDLAINVLVVCDEYLLKDLKNLCEEFLASSITLKNFVVIAELAETFELQLLHNAVMKFVLDNFGIMKTREDLFSLPKNFLVKALIGMYETKSDS